MSRKSTVTKTEVEKAVKAPKVVKAPKEKAVKASKEKAVKAPKEKVSKKVKAKEEDEDVLSDVEDGDDTSTETKKRHVPTKETVSESFDELVAVIDEEIVRLRETQSKAKGVKFLRSLGKRVKTLRTQAARVMKQKQHTTRKNNSNSGFLKPVKISPEMAKFTGWDPKELKSRVDVTKHICNYIRENNLQNPTDRRQILADPKLSKLLNFDSKKEEKPLTYYRIQSFMKPHFIKEE